MATPADDNNRRTRSIRLPDSDVEMLLNKLDTDRPHERSVQRQHERFAYRVKACKVRLQQPGSMAPTPFTVPTRDLSAGGMSFLHGNFVHGGTRVFVQLITQHGTWADITGEVVRCEYLENGVHEVCVRFDHEVQPSDFCAAALRFRVLLAEDDDAIARLATHHLEKLNAEVDRAENGKVAVEKALSGTYDCIFMDMEMPVLDGFAAAISLRSRGYTGRIIAVTAMTRPEDHERCLKEGCNQYVPKPVPPDRYRKLLESLRQEPLTSAYQDDPAMRDLLVDFVDAIPQQIRRIEEFLLEEEMAQLEHELRSLKGTAGGYGFEPVSSAAQAAETAIQKGADANAARRYVEEVIHLCMQVRSPGKDERSSRQDG